MGFFEQILTLFGFTKHQSFVAAVCMVILLSNLFGGLLRNILLAFGGPIKPRTFTETLGFRMALASEAMLVLFATYYHAMLISYVTAVHVVFWMFTLLASPVLAYIGAQVTFLVFQKRIEDRIKAYIVWDRNMKSLRLAEREAAKQAKANPPKRPARSFAPGRK
ncbi:MAG: hypothetical protein H7841_09230 [Magnetospirillum sp. WYHS-4]